MTTPDITAARQFMAANARVLELRRFEYLFAGGNPAPIRDAVAAYRNPDGGFGHGLEPDCRCPASHPMAIDLALRTLHEAEVWDQTLVDGALRWLAEHAPPEGGAVFPGPYAAGWPHAPWYTPNDDRKVSLLSTASIAATLHARKVTHPWLDRATDLVWSLLEAPTSTDPEELHPAVRFLDHVPDRRRVQEVVDDLGQRLFDHGLVTLDPKAPGRIHTPLDYAPFPQSSCRVLFDAPTIAAHLDHLAAAQQDDGGWPINFTILSPVAERAWRAHFTVEALVVLRANGRL
ncbi:MAG: hypothetical protein HKP61_16395 [Dactylosporangium sp.]|nr:hypothetical protein [Dactylosporangium sp.]NNJ62487.1 hypothetical protein [Dactylosporangium sp.]